MESHLTLCSLHKGQTSQNDFAGAAAALEALTDIRESPQLVSGKTRSGKWANFLTFLPPTGRENNSPRSLAQGKPAFHLRRFRPAMNLINSGKIFEGEGAHEKRPTFSESFKMAKRPKEVG